MKKKITVKYVDTNEDKRAYLQLIQEPICRMSTISAIFKGFAASIVAGIAVISYEIVNTWILFLSFIPVVAFFVLDVYYLKLERKFRYLYEKVRKNEKELDFSLSITNNPVEIIAAKATTIECLKSPSIKYFYPILIIILIAVLGLRCGGVI